MTAPLYGATWSFTGDADIMTDELGHRRHADKVPCFLGGSKPASLVAFVVAVKPAAPFPEVVVS